jgi:aspartate carbamoyltransferase catalytic subunit
LFYEPSTRTEISFELASARLGATVVRCDVARSSVQKGESLVDTVQTLEALGAQAIVIRHPSAGAPHLASRWVRCAIINAGDGMHEHPTQGLLDLLTVRQHRGRIAGLNVAIVGDVLHSRVARSAVWGFTTLGAHVTLVGPPTLLPVWPTADDRFPRAPQVTMTSSLAKGLEHADVVMALRMQRERQQNGYVPSLAEYTGRYAITPSVLATARPDVLVLHPGPMNLGVEVSAEAAYGPQSGIRAQVTNGVAVRMAVLLWALGDEDAHDRRTARRDVPDELPVRDRAVAEIVQTVGER